MTDPHTVLTTLRRPRLLVRAARLGLLDYNRDHSLRRLMPGETPPRPGMAFAYLAEHEAALNATRREGAASYSVARHIELLVALIEEARLATNRFPDAKAA